MKDVGRPVHSVDVVKKKSSSGCLIIKRKVVDGDGGVRGFSDSPSRNLFVSKEKKRPRLVTSDSESSDEFTEPYGRKIDRSRDRLGYSNGDFMSSREAEARKRGSNGVGFDEYDRFHERRIRKDVYDHDIDHRLKLNSNSNSHWENGDPKVSGSGGSSSKRISDNQRDFVHRDRRSYGDVNHFKREDDGYRQVSDVPIRLQGKNGVLKVMVKKQMPIPVPFQNHAPAQPEELKESRPAFHKHKPLNVPHKSDDRREISSKDKAVVGSSSYPVLKKPVLSRCKEKSDSDATLPVKSSTVMHSSIEKLVKSEKKLSPETKDVTPVEGKGVKVKRGTGTEKQLLREKIRSMLLGAGWSIDYRPRRNRDYLDAVYISPSGTAYWSIIKAYEALQKEGKGHSQVGGEFTPLPVETLSKLTRQTRKKIEREMKKRKEEGKASQESGDDSNDNGYIEAANKRNLGLDSHVLQGRTSNKLGRCTLLIRSDGKKPEDDQFVPYPGKRTLLSWLIDSGTVQMSEKVQYMNCKKTRIMQEGWITREGIHCCCCSKILPVLKFELHAGSKLKQPYSHIIVQSGRSLTECLVDAWNKQGELERKGFHTVDVVGDDPNDDTCGLCGDGGDLICCDGCPSTFHQSCLGIQMLPQGDWHCPKCSCKYCGKATEDVAETDHTLLVCCLCEKKYHELCRLRMDDNLIDLNSSFCSPKCLQLHNNLQKLVGVKHELDSGFSWALIHRSDLSSLLSSPNTFSSMEISGKVECNSKLAVALSVIDECFVPIVDRRSGVNLINNVVYNCGSNFSRLNYTGFFTAILERADEMICAASIRIHGTELAEMPFIGTRHMYRRQGMCRRLLSAIESALASLRVEKLIIPAITEHMHTWTNVFGFKPLEESHRQEMRSMNMLVFPGIDMLHKKLDHKTILEIKKPQPVSPDDKELGHTDSDSQDPPTTRKAAHSDSIEAKRIAQDANVERSDTQICNSISSSIPSSIPSQEPGFGSKNSGLRAGMESVSAD